jgi:hypothetical protein
MRVYLPATSTIVAAVAGDGEVGPPPVTAFAVTPGVREWYRDDDADELEYAASGQAVRASLRLVDSDPTAARRRVVLAFDVADDAVTVRDDLDRGAVVVNAVLPLSGLAAIHIDDADAEATVARAASVVLEADLGSDSSQEIVDDAEGFELSWYAPQELTEVLATLGRDAAKGS